MKKIILGIATVLFSPLTCIPAYAADKPIKTLPNITDIPVYAAYVDATGFSIIPTDKDGNGSMTLTNGTIITVSGADSARGRIAVEEVTDKEVLDWITEQFEDKTNGTKAYHVYLLDDNGVSKPVDDVKIMVKPKKKQPLRFEKRDCLYISVIPYLLIRILHRSSPTESLPS